MIGYLKGKIISAKPTKVLIDVNGVGYLVNISISTFEKISGEEIISLFIYTNVKEDAITLFGFFTEVEKEMFELLISVNGIGPKIALNILSSIQYNDLKYAIETSDVARIVAVPGIGRKSAERLILELKGKLGNIATGAGDTVIHGFKHEAVMALSTLGYNSKIAEKVVSDLLQKAPDLSLEEIIKKALSALIK
jgi:holliday junction DNA helicase RuvA